MNGLKLTGVPQVLVVYCTSFQTHPYVRKYSRCMATPVSSNLSSRTKSITSPFHRWHDGYRAPRPLQFFRSWHGCGCDRKDCQHVNVFPSKRHLCGIYPLFLDETLWVKAKKQNDLVDHGRKSEWYRHIYAYIYIYTIYIHIIIHIYINKFTYIYIYIYRYQHYYNREAHDQPLDFVEGERPTGWWFPR